MATSIEAPPLAKSGSTLPPRELMDVVALVADHKSIDAWRQVLSRYHVVIVSSTKSDSNASIDLPDYELHSLEDARRTLKIPNEEEKDPKSLARSYGILVSQRKYVVLVDLDDTSPIHDPLEQHLTNLITPSTPYFFNTLYDPFRNGADFVRGYPFSLRNGVTTAVSNGVWCQDGSTVVDAVLTIPRGVFFPMSPFNVAFDRELVGPVLGSCGSNVLISGLILKIICDHLGYGVKSGLPYVKLTGTSSAAEELDGDVLEFFRSIQLPSTIGRVEDCILEICKLMAKVDKLSSLGKSMEAWIEAHKK